MKGYNRTRCGHPRINDMMMFFPKKYFEYMKYILYIHTAHDQWEIFMHYTDLEYKDLDTMLSTYHDSDSFKDFNPLYRVVNRKECETTFDDKTSFFDKYSSEYKSSSSFFNG